MEKIQYQTPIGVLPAWIEYRIENDLVIKDPCVKCKNPVNAYSVLTQVCANCAN